MIGSVSRRQKPYFFLSISSGISSSTTWPTAEEMTYSSFSKWSPFFGTLPSARARSCATLGFSAMMRDLAMKGCQLDLVGVVCKSRQQDRGRAYASFTKYFPGSCLTSRFSSRRRRVEETVPLGRSHFAAIWSIGVSVGIDRIIDPPLVVGQLGQRPRRRFGRRLLLSGRRICKSSRISLASMTSFAPCWMSRFDPCAVGALM